MRHFEVDPDVEQALIDLGQDLDRRATSIMEGAGQMSDVIAVHRSRRGVARVAVAGVAALTLVGGLAALASVRDDSGGVSVGGPAVGDRVNGPLAASPLSGRFGHVAVWTGEEMLVWGGDVGATNVALNDGAAYDPDNDTWRRIADAPIVGRWGHVAVWTGKEMIVWGGATDNGVAIADGAVYDPNNDSWRRIADPPIVGRQAADAVWTGTEMIVWGGFDGLAVPDGAAYDPTTDSWRDLPPAPLPVGGPQDDATWTGDEMVVVTFPSAAHGNPLALAAYNPVSNRWRVLPDAPTTEESSVVSADGAVVLLPVDETTMYALIDGSDSWRQSARTVSPGEFLDGFWADNQVVVATATGALRYSASKDAWTLVEASATPSPGRSQATAVWDGSGVIVWGGVASLAPDDVEIRRDGFRISVSGGEVRPAAFESLTVATNVDPQSAAPDEQQVVIVGDSNGLPRGWIDRSRPLRDTGWRVQLYEVRNGTDGDSEVVGYFGCQFYEMAELSEPDFSPRADCGS